MGYVHSHGCRLYDEDAGDGVPILLIHPAGSTASTWGAAAGELARLGQVITYDRRGYARSRGEPVRSMSTHTADAAALLDHLQVPRAVVVGTSAGACADLRCQSVAFSLAGPTTSCSRSVPVSAVGSRRRRR